MTEMSQKWAKNKPKLKQQCTWIKIDEIQDSKWTKFIYDKIHKINQYWTK